jgi:hypothetical protein
VRTGALLANLQTASGLHCLPGYEDLKKRTFGRAFLFRTVVLQTDVCYNVGTEKNNKNGARRLDYQSKLS